ncbi:hypothetical protein V6N13_045441 [Hibiscus sabdariffa]
MFYSKSILYGLKTKALRRIQNDSSINFSLPKDFIIAVRCSPPAGNPCAASCLLNLFCVKFQLIGRAIRISESVIKKREWTTAVRFVLTIWNGLHTVLVVIGTSAPRASLVSASSATIAAAASAKLNPTSSSSLRR